MYSRNIERDRNVGERPYVVIHPRDDNRSRSIPDLSVSYSLRRPSSVSYGDVPVLTRISEKQRNNAKIFTISKPENANGESRWELMLYWRRRESFYVGSDNSLADVQSRSANDEPNFRGDKDRIKKKKKKKKELSDSLPSIIDALFQLDTRVCRINQILHVKRLRSRYDVRRSIREGVNDGKRGASA